MSKAQPYSNDPIANDINNNFIEIINELKSNISINPNYALNKTNIN